MERENFKCGGAIWHRERPGLYATTLCGVRLELHGEYGAGEPWPFTVCKVISAGAVEAREWLMRPCGRNSKLVISRYSSRIGAALKAQDRLVKYRKCGEKLVTGRNDYEKDAQQQTTPAEDQAAADAAREASIEERRDSIRERQNEEGR